MPSTASAAPPRVRQLGHIVLYVADLDRSLAFYHDLLGWPVVAAPQYAPAVIFRAGETHHDLLLIGVGKDATPQPHGRRLGLYHFGVKVGETDEQLKAVVDQLRTRPDLTTILGLVDGGFVHSAYVTDPDGNEIELYIDVPGWDWNDPALFDEDKLVRRQLDI
jgi:catechol 2,3-dioxygenase